MGVEPLPNIRDDILVERIVKITRYVSDMRRREYVVEGPEGVRRRQRLNVEYVDRLRRRFACSSTRWSRLARRRLARATR